MMYFAALVAIVFFYGLVILISGSTELTADVRKNLPPEDIEAIHEELKWRRQVGVLMLLITQFPIMTYLCFYL